MSGREQVEENQALTGRGWSVSAEQIAGETAQRPKIVQSGVWAWRVRLRGAPQQLGQHFALLPQRLALLP